MRAVADPTRRAILRLVRDGEVAAELLTRSRVMVETDGIPAS